MENIDDFVIENGVLIRYTGRPQGWEIPPDIIDVKIPPGVVEIGESAFSGHHYIESVEIPEGVVGIGRYAFRGAERLAKVKFPSTLEWIGERAFYGCRMLASAEIPSNVTRIDGGAFERCEALTSFRFPDGVTEVSGGVLSGCSKLVSVHIPEGVTRIGGSAFFGCGFTSVHLPACVTEIGMNAFGWCKELREINIPEHCTIGESAFVDCKALVNDAGMLIVHNRLFSHYQGESGEFSVVIPDHVEKIESRALVGYGKRHLEMNLHCPAWEEPLFYDIAYGSTISFRDDSGIIRAKVILDCSDESDPKKVAAIRSFRQENHAFDFAGYDANWVNLGRSANKIRIALVRIQYPYALSDEMRQVYETYLTSQGQRAGKMFIDEENAEMLKVLVEKHFVSRNGLPKLVDYANHQGKTSMTALLLMSQHAAAQSPAPKKVPKSRPKEKLPWKKPKLGTHQIGRYLGNESHVKFPLEIDGVAIDGIADTSGSVPENYQAIRSVEIPEGYISIGRRAFAGCRNLTQVKIPHSLKFIGPGAFADCTSLEVIHLPGDLDASSQFTFPEGSHQPYITIYSPEFASRYSKPIYLGGTIEDLPSKERRKAALGFVYAAEHGITEIEPWRGSYLSHIKRNMKHFLKDISKNETLFRFVLKESLVTARYIDELVKIIAKLDRPDLMAELLNYNQSVISPKQSDEFSIDIVDRETRQREQLMIRQQEIQGKRGMKGLTFAASGDLENFGGAFGRNDLELKEYIESRGGNYRSAISWKTDYLICNDPGSSTVKIREAKSRGVLIISEREFLKMAEEQEEMSKL